MWQPVKTALLLALPLVLLGCPPAGDEKGKKTPAPSASCSAVGQSCEFSPGKLGTCVSKDPCTGNDCLVCQSQH